MIELLNLFIFTALLITTIFMCIAYFFHAGNAYL